MKINNCSQCFLSTLGQARQHAPMATKKNNEKKKKKPTELGVFLFIFLSLSCLFTLFVDCLDSSTLAGVHSIK